MKRSDLKSAKMRDREGIIHVRKLTRKIESSPGAWRRAAVQLPRQPAKTTPRGYWTTNANALAGRSGSLPCRLLWPLSGGIFHAECYVYAILDPLVKLGVQQTSCKATLKGHARRKNMILSEESRACVVDVYETPGMWLRVLAERRLILKYQVGRSGWWTDA